MWSLSSSNRPYQNKVYLPQSFSELYGILSYAPQFIQLVLYWLTFYLPNFIKWISEGVTGLCQVTWIFTGSPQTQASTLPSQSFFYSTLPLSFNFWFIPVPKGRSKGYTGEGLLRQLLSQGFHRRTGQRVDTADRMPARSFHKEWVRHVPSNWISKNIETKNIKESGGKKKPAVWFLNQFLIMSVIYLNVHTYSSHQY